MVPLFWNEDLKKRLRDTLSNSEVNTYNITNWALSIRGNRVGAIITDVNRAEPQDMYQSIVVSENIFQLDEKTFISNSFIARYITIVNNQFMYQPQQDNNMTLAFVLGYDGVIMGNMGITRRLFIDALIVQDLVGAEPFLNMLTVRP